MSLISKRGQEVKEAVEKDNIDLKKVFIRLKDGQSIRVRLLGVQDYVQYKAHSNGFNFGIYTQPCLNPTGVECPLCKAYEHDKETYKDLRPSNRYLVAMADLDEGMIRVWDCSKTQLKNLISQIEEYAEQIEDEDEEIMFTFKRTGTKTTTTYTLSPIMAKRALNELSDAYHSFDDKVVEDSFFEGCLVPRTKEVIMSALQQAGLPIKDIFPDYISDEDLVAKAEDYLADVAQVEDDDLPF